MLFKIILFLITIKSISSLNSNDFCYSNEVMCLNNRECTKECNDFIRKYKCSDNLCTINETKCDEYMKKEYIGLLITTNFIHRFQSKIKYCSKIAFKFKSNDVCLKKNNCYKIRFHFNWLPNTVYVTTIKKDCECNGKHAFICGDHFCAANNKACDAFIHLKPKLKNKFKILKCN
jgi:hypothetical protein